MNRPELDEIRALASIDPAGDPDPRAHEAPAARDLLAAVTASPREEGPRGRSGGVRARRWVLGVAAAAALTAVLVVAPNVLDRDAYADWTDVPSAPAAEDADAAALACREMWHLGLDPDGADGPSPAQVDAAPLVLAEERGGVTYTVLADDTWAMDCLAVPEDGSSGGMLAPLGASSPPAAGEVDPFGVAGFSSDASGVLVMTLFGRAGSDVTGVVVHVPEIGTVQATVTNGWFAAWVPGVPDAALAGPEVRLTVYRADGSTSQVSAQNLWDAAFRDED